MNKKIIYSLLIFAAFLLSTNVSSALTPINDKILGEDICVESCDDNTQEEIGIIKKFSLKEKLKKSPESQINDFFKKYNRYAEKNNIEKLKEMYDDNFVNNDGFNKETVFKMMEMAADAYENIEYVTNIENIKVNGNYAIIDAHETAKGKTAREIKGLDDTGLVESDIYFTNYLRKDGNKWKITAANVKSEIVSLKYGEAKNMDISVTAPECIASGTDYETGIKINTPAESFVVGSIVNEPIVFPVEQAKDVYRAVKSDELSRILKSNTNNNNEYAAISLAITRAKVELPDIVINMTGMAFVMKRVNVIKVNDKIKLDEVNFNDNKEG